MRFSQEDREDTLALPISTIKEDPAQLNRYFESLTIDELWGWTRALMRLQGDVSTIYNRKLNTEMTKGKNS